MEVETAIKTAVAEQTDNKVDVSYLTEGANGHIYLLCGDWHIFENWMHQGGNTLNDKTCTVVKDTVVSNEYHPFINSTRIVAKIQKITENCTIKDALHEVKCHNVLCCSETKLPNGEIVCGSSVCPIFIAGCVIEVNKRHKFHITLMEYLEGATMLQTLHITRSKLLDVNVYLSIERALCVMWMCGMAHSDVHRGNIMVLPDKTIRLIDFGLAITMPQVLHQSLLKGMFKKSIVPDKLYDEYYKNEVVRVLCDVYNIKIDDINFDSNLLQKMRRWWCMRGEAQLVKQLRSC